VELQQASDRLEPHARPYHGTLLGLYRKDTASNTHAATVRRSPVILPTAHTGAVASRRRDGTVRPDDATVAAMTG